MEFRPSFGDATMARASPVTIDDRGDRRARSERKPMSTIRAIYEGGVFRPIEPVDLPDHSTVEIVLRRVGDTVTEVDFSQSADMSAIYEVLSRRYSGGDPTISERHNEHQS
jgi:predicted DNA-binding antitoxin AbrB/MazE fold protein